MNMHDLIEKAKEVADQALALGNNVGELQEMLKISAETTATGGSALSPFMIGLTVFVLAIFVGYYVVGCAGQGFQNSQEIVDFGWAEHPPQTFVPAPLYCYKTLGSIDCYRTKQPHLEDRLVNYYGPVPEEDAQIGRVLVRESLVRESIKQDNMPAPIELR